MDFQVREELTILSLIFCFCILSIPLIIVKDNLDRHEFRHKAKSLRDAEFEKKVLVHSVGIMESISSRKSVNDSEFELSDLMEITEAKFVEKFPWLTPNDFDDEGNLTEIWEQFDFHNGTVLLSNSSLLPLKVDWREKKIITEVQSQGSCGSCFALAVVEAIESMAAKDSNLTSLSVQQMLDCNIFRMNCDGGDPTRLLKWLFRSQMNIQTREDYPSVKYSKTNQICDYTKVNANGVKLKDYSENEQQEELILFYLAYQGPLIASINGTTLKSYKNKIVEGDCDPEFKNLNHVVQIVGYDLSGNVPFYIVKNSWGLTFGESGYMKIAIGSNVCGIAQRISTVVV